MQGFCNNVPKNTYVVLRFGGCPPQNKVDLISRTGGEEFEVVARGLDEPAALRLAEAIREQIAALQFEQGPKVSASLGVALSHPNEALSSLRQRADAAAYQAKQTGRNRVQLAT